MEAILSSFLHFHKEQYVRIIFASIVAIALTTFSTASSAIMIVSDVKNPYVFLSETGLQSKTVIHDLTDNGVPKDYQVHRAALRLGFSDGYKHYDWALDWAEVTADGISRKMEVDGTHRWGFDIRWLRVDKDGIDTLNKYGKLEVTVTALNTDKDKNDFWWKKSKLIAKLKPTPVPEPGMLGLLGLGLLGVGTARWFRKA